MATCTNTSTVIGELSRGRDTADRLRRALRESSSVPPAQIQGLVAQVMDSLTHSISMLVHNNSEGSSETPKDRRGCHKRRRSCETSTKLTPAWPEDGYAWRKYGQKHILSTKHPRSYFRCTHKHDQGCQATKQVQKIQDHPPLFKSIYHGHHSCNNYSNHRRHLMIMEEDNASSLYSSSIIWSFKQESPSPTAAQTSLSDNTVSVSVCGGDYLVSACSDPPDSCSATTTTHPHIFELAHDDTACFGLQ